MIDYDGTLVPIADRPQSASTGQGLRRTLKRLAGKNRVRLAVVSGRDLDDLEKLVPAAGICLVGCHGAEFLRAGGGKTAIVRLENLAPALDLIAAAAARCVGRRRGFLLERKKAAVALHYRLADPAAASRVLGGFIAAIYPLARRHNLVYTAGKKVIEIRPRGINKGEAVKHLIRLYPGCYPVYLGDDSTDEDAFRAIREQGAGILVSEGERLTSASSRLRNPGDVHRFLQIIATRC
jgi:trehalose 6-phosphate phosphatase